MKLKELIEGLTSEEEEKEGDLRDHIYVEADKVSHKLWETKKLTTEMLVRMVKLTEHFFINSIDDEEDKHDVFFEMWGDINGGVSDEGDKTDFTSFDNKEFKKTLNNSKIPNKYRKEISGFLPKDIAAAKAETKEIRKTATKLPKKKMELK